MSVIASHIVYIRIALLPSVTWLKDKVGSALTRWFSAAAGEEDRCTIRARQGDLFCTVVLKRGLDARKAV